MKNTILVFILSIMLNNSFAAVHDKTEEKPNRKAVLQLGNQVLQSLKHNSVMEFLNLFPSYDDFASMMEENKDVYGSTLEIAKSDFRDEYYNNILPKVVECFNALITEGEKRGIDWNHVRINDAEMLSESTTAGQFILTISSNGKKFSILVEKSVFRNGSRYISQFVKLV